MIQEITEAHVIDADGNPAGGHTEGLGLLIAWQTGPLGRGSDRGKPNGAFVEGVIQAAIGRLQFYQGTRFACHENARALTLLEGALAWLHSRTGDREARGVEGTHVV